MNEMLQRDKKEFLCHDDTIYQPLNLVKIDKTVAIFEKSGILLPKKVCGGCINV